MRHARSRARAVLSESLLAAAFPGAEPSPPVGRGKVQRLVTADATDDASNHDPECWFIYSRSRGTRLPSRSAVYVYSGMYIYETRALSRLRCREAVVKAEHCDVFVYVEPSFIRDTKIKNKRNPS